METKICLMCKKEKPLSSFHKKKSSSDGYRFRCKECRKEESRLYYHQNKEQLSRKGEIYREKNRDICIQRAKRWAEENIFRYWASVTRRNHKYKKKYVVNISLAELTKMAEKTLYCPLCNVKLDYSLEKGRIFDNSPSLDRKNNTNVLNIMNVWVICQKCNTTKQNRTIKEFISYCKLVVKKLEVKA